jgi:hypothetical protein
MRMEPGARAGRAADGGVLLCDYVSGGGRWGGCAMDGEEGVGEGKARE